MPPAQPEQGRGLCHTCSTNHLPCRYAIDGCAHRVSNSQTAGGRIYVCRVNQVTCVFALSQAQRRCMTQRCPNTRDVAGNGLCTPCTHQEVPCANGCSRRSSVLRHPFCDFCPRTAGYSVQAPASQSVGTVENQICDIPKFMQLIGQGTRCQDCIDGYLLCSTENCTKRNSTPASKYCDACILKDATVLRLRAKSAAVPCFFYSRVCRGAVPSSNGSTNGVCKQCSTTGPPCIGRKFSCRRRCAQGQSRLCVFCQLSGLPCCGKDGRGCRDREKAVFREGLWLVTKAHV